jgi:hypothetical protein
MNCRLLFLTQICPPIVQNQVLLHLFFFVGVVKQNTDGRGVCVIVLATFDSPYESH